MRVARVETIRRSLLRRRAYYFKCGGNQPKASRVSGPDEFAPTIEERKLQKLARRGEKYLLWHLEAI